LSELISDTQNNKTGLSEWNYVTPKHWKTKNIVVKRVQRNPTLFTLKRC